MAGSETLTPDQLPAEQRDHPRHRLPSIVSEHLGWWTAALLVSIAVVFVLVTRMRPEYDAYGWLVWGRRALHWNLDTNGAPSWKPLTFLFTFPYALAGRGQPFLWMVTSVAASLAGAVFAARIAYRLTGPSPGRRYAPILAGLFAGVGIFGIDGYWQLILNANSDPMVVTLCLAAIDCQLSGRPRLAFLMLVLASLGRPEAWAFTGLYAAWCWRAHPSMRPVAVAGVLAIPVLWFVIPALTSRSWFHAGDLALNSKNIIHGNKIIGVPSRFLGLYSVPMKLASAFALALALYRRDRIWLTLAGAALLWIVIETVFALYGWSAVPRYLIEPAAVMIVLAGAGVGSVLAGQPETRRALRFAAELAVGMLVVALVPTARTRVRAAHDAILARHHAGVQIDRLHDVIDRDGGPDQIRACGQPVTVLGFQSTLAWELEMNVGNVGFRPGRSIRKGDPIVFFKPDRLGWHVRPIHTSASQVAQCATLRADTDTG